MKRSTRNKIFAGFIILTFALSSLAYVFTIFTGGGLPQQQEFKPLQSLVVEGHLDQRVESAYVQGRFTSLRFYYSDDSLISFVDQLPYVTRTNTDQQQLIVQKIPANETYASIVTLNGNEEVRNVTRENLIVALCRSLTVKPLECVTLNLTR